MELILGELTNATEYVPPPRGRPALVARRPLLLPQLLRQREVYHRSPTRHNELRPSDGGHLGPGIYTSPNVNAFQSYGDVIHTLPMPEVIAELRMPSGSNTFYSRLAYEHDLTPAGLLLKLLGERFDRRLHRPSPYYWAAPPKDRAAEALYDYFTRMRSRGIDAVLGGTEAFPELVIIPTDPGATPVARGVR